MIRLRFWNLRQKDEESETKSNYQDREDEKDFDQSLQDFQEHHHVDSNLIETLKVQKQIEPRQKNCQRCCREQKVAFVSIHEYRGNHDERCDVQKPRDEVDGLE